MGGGGVPRTPALASGPGWQSPSCYPTFAILGVPKAGMTQTSYTTHSISLGATFASFVGEEAQKIQNSNKKGGGEEVYGGKHYIKMHVLMCHYVTSVLEQLPKLRAASAAG